MGHSPHSVCRFARSCKSGGRVCIVQLSIWSCRRLNNEPIKCGTTPLMGLDEILSSSSDKHCLSSRGSSVNELWEMSRTTRVGARTRRKAGSFWTSSGEHRGKRRCVMPDRQHLFCTRQLDVPDKEAIFLSVMTSRPPSSLRYAVSSVFSLPSSTMVTA